MTTKMPEGPRGWLRYFLGADPKPQQAKLFLWLWARPEELQKVPPAFEKAGTPPDYDRGGWQEIMNDWGYQLDLPEEDWTSSEWHWDVPFVSGGVIMSMSMEGLIDVTTCAPIS